MMMRSASLSPRPSYPTRSSTSSLRRGQDLTFNRIGSAQRDSILQAGLALQQAGVIPASADVKKSLDDLIDDRYLMITN